MLKIMIIIYGQEKLGYNCKGIFSNLKIKYFDYRITTNCFFKSKKNNDNYIFISFINIIDDIKD